MQIAIAIQIATMFAFFPLFVLSIYASGKQFTSAKWKAINKAADTKAFLLLLVVLSAVPAAIAFRSTALRDVFGFAQRLWDAGSELAGGTVWVVYNSALAAMTLFFVGVVGYFVIGAVKDAIRKSQNKTARFKY